jgi:hypothetical protein
VLLLAFAALAPLRAAGQTILRGERSSASDLEVGGKLKGVPAGDAVYPVRGSAGADGAGFFAERVNYSGLVRGGGRMISLSWN